MTQLGDLSERCFSNCNQVQRRLGIQHLGDQIEPAQILSDATNAVLLAILRYVIGKIALQTSLSFSGVFNIWRRRSAVSRKSWSIRLDWINPSLFSTR